MIKAMIAADRFHISEFQECVWISCGSLSVQPVSDTNVVQLSKQTGGGPVQNVQQVSCVALVCIELYSNFTSPRVLRESA